MSDVQQMSKMERDDLAALSQAWWLPVVVGVMLMIYSFVVLSFTMSTVYAISVGLGIGLILSGIGDSIVWQSATSCFEASSASCSRSRPVASATRAGGF